MKVNNALKYALGSVFKSSYNTYLDGGLTNDPIGWDSVSPNKMMFEFADWLKKYY